MREGGEAEGSIRKGEKNRGGGGEGGVNKLGRGSERQ